MKARDGGPRDGFPGLAWDGTCVRTGELSSGALGVLSGSSGETPIAAFPKPPSLKARAPGRIKGSRQKGSKAVQRQRETEDEVSSHIQGEGFHLPAFESGAKVGKVTTRLKFKWCRMGDGKMKHRLSGQGNKARAQPGHLAVGAHIAESQAGGARRRHCSAEE